MLIPNNELLCFSKRDAKEGLGHLALNIQTCYRCRSALLRKARKGAAPNLVISVKMKFDLCIGNIQLHHLYLRWLFHPERVRHVSCQFGAGHSFSIISLAYKNFKAVKSKRGVKTEKLFVKPKRLWNFVINLKLILFWG